MPFTIMGKIIIHFSICPSVLLSPPPKELTLTPELLECWPILLNPAAIRFNNDGVPLFEERNLLSIEDRLLTLEPATPAAAPAADSVWPNAIDWLSRVAYFPVSVSIFPIRELIADSSLNIFSVKVSFILGLNACSYDSRNPLNFSL